MLRIARMTIVCGLLVVRFLCTAAHADILVSANEGKYELSSGVGREVASAEPDSLTILDFAEFPPRARHVLNVANSVIGPPTNVALTPDERWVLVANSVRRYTDDPKRPEPDDTLQVLDLAAKQPSVVTTVRVGRQPSGLAINRAGNLALVANRADGTVSVLTIDGGRVAVRETLTVGDAQCEPADVCFNPAGTLALVSLNKAAQVRVLRVGGSHVEVLDRKLPVYGQPYHIQITADGALGLVAGGGGQNGPDSDLMSLIDLAGPPLRTIDHVPVGTGPESFDISPDGQWVATVLMEGSNVAADDPQRVEHAQLRLWRREGTKLAKVQELAIGRIPEGVCFTRDGRYLVVQEHVAKQLAIYGLQAGKLRDTGARIPVPGFPAALRRADVAR